MHSKGKHKNQDQHLKYSVMTNPPNLNKNHPVNGN